VTDLDVRLVCPCVPVTDTALVISKLVTLPGDDKLTFKGRFVLPLPLTPPLDPRAYGLRLVLSDAGGTVLDATLAPGAFVDPPGVGWKVHAGNKKTKWTYINRSAAPPFGLRKVVLQDDSPTTPGRVRVAITGKGGSYPVVAAQLPLAGLVVLYPPSAQCGEAVFPGPPAPACVLSKSGSTVKCR
jgi:hypothetical protein